MEYAPSNLFDESRFMLDAGLAFYVLKQRAVILYDGRKSIYAVKVILLNMIICFKVNHHKEHVTAS